MGAATPVPLRLRPAAGVVVFPAVAPTAIRAGRHIDVRSPAALPCRTARQPDAVSRSGVCHGCRDHQRLRRAHAPVRTIQHCVVCRRQRHVGVDVRPLARAHPRIRRRNHERRGVQGSRARRYAGHSGIRPPLYDRVA